MKKKNQSNDNERKEQKMNMLKKIKERKEKAESNGYLSSTYMKKKFESILLNDNNQSELFS